MAFNITYKKSIHRDLRKIGKSEAKKVVDQLEKELSKKADKYPVLKGEFAGLRKYRVGDYRVVYVIIESDVIVLRIRHRKDVYK